MEAEGNQQPIEQQGRPAEPAFALGPSAILLQNPEATAYDSITRSEQPPLRQRPPSASQPSQQEILHDIRADTKTRREQFLASVKAHAAAANTKKGEQPADKSDRQRLDTLIQTRKEVYDHLTDQPPVPATPEPGAPLLPEPAAANEVIESFTSPGTLLRQHEELLTENRFESTRVLQTEHSQQFKEDFRRHYEAVRDAEERRERVALAEGDKLRTNNLDSVLPPNGGIGSTPSTADQPKTTPDSLANRLTNPNELDRLNKPRITQHLIDSRNRDKDRYPNPNSYTIQLDRRFNDVKRIKLISSEIPNTSILIRDDPREVLLEQRKLLLKCGETLNDANKHIYWLNEEDGTDPGQYDCVVYDGCITPGNYVTDSCDCNERTLAQEIEEVVSGINRFVRNTPHEFQVTIDPQTNITSILSVQSQQLGVNPISTTAGTNILVFSQLAHPFNVGDRVTITGATAVGGIPASIINDNHEILETTTDMYTIRVTTNSLQTTSGGGANIEAGFGAPFMLLASNLDTPFSSILGFPQQDSAQQIATPIEFINSQPPDLATTVPIDCETAVSPPGTLPAWICAPDHGLVTGERILITDTSTIPPINGLHTVTGVISSDTFEIGEPIKVVNNQVTTTQFVLGCIIQSRDEEVSQITALTLSQSGYICTEFLHSLAEGDTVWLGNLIGGLTKEGLQPLNGIQTVGDILNANCFNIVNGVIFAGTEFGNAFAVKTTSDHLVPITSIVPANNGRFCPASTVPVYTGSARPEYMLLLDTETSPDINGIISVDVDVTGGNCNNVIVKSKTDDIWQSFTANVTGKLVDVYVSIGEGQVLDIAAMKIFEGEGTGGTQLGTIGDHAFVDRDVCTGAHLCVPSIELEQGQVYTWQIELQSAIDQQVALCYDTTNPYSGGRSDLGAGIDYQFRTYMSPGVQAVEYYSETSGKFTLETVIDSVSFQNPNQSYIRSLDSSLRCVQDALVASHGIFTFSEPHNFVPGDRIFVNAASGVSTTQPFVSPNIIGSLLTVDQILDATRLDTSTAITFSSYPTSGLELQAVKTNALEPSKIVNIYPRSTGYLCKELQSCDPSRPQCVLCPGDQVIIRGGSGNIAADYESNLLEFDSGGLLLGNVYGCYTLSQVFNEASSVCDTIFDLELPDGGYIDLPDPVSDIGECARLDTEGGVSGHNGIFGVAQVYFQSEVCSIGINSVATNKVQFQQLPEIIYANANFVLGLQNRRASVLPTNPFQPTAPLSGVLHVNWPNHGRSAVPNDSRFVFSRMETPPAGENNPPSIIRRIGFGGWSVVDANTLAWSSYTGLGNVDFGGSTVIATPVRNATASPNPSMFWNINTPTVNYFVWYQMQFPSSGVRGTKPSGAIVAGRASIPSGAVGIILDTFDTLDNIAIKTKAAIDAEAPIAIEFPVVISGDTLTIQNTAFGAGTVIDGSPVEANIGVTEVLPGSIASTQPTEFINALSVQSSQPHSLDSGDYVYIIDPVLAPNCDISSTTFSGNVISEVHNSVGFVITDPIDATRFNIFGLTVVSGITDVPTLCQTPLPDGIRPIDEGLVFYHKICGSSFTPIADFYPKSYNGMFESLNHGMTGNTTQIFIGQSTVTPDVNGCETVCVIDENFFTLTPPIDIMIGDVTSPSGCAAQYVETVNTTDCSDPCAPRSIINIDTQNDGVIISPNSFQGGECVYFLNNTNINLGSTNELRNNFFTISTTGLSSTQFSLDVPISTIGGVFGNPLFSCETQVFNQPGEYCFIAGSSEYEIVMSGAGGGNGLDYTADQTGSPGIGGRGALVQGIITVPVGSRIYVRVGGAGENGKFNADSVGGFNGGANSQSNGLPTGNGAGGGATDIRIDGNTPADRVVVAGGGGGGTGYFPALNPIFSDPTTAIAQLQVGYDGGHGGGSFASPDGTPGGGNVGPSPYNAAGKAGTTASGGAGGFEFALFALHTANAGTLTGEGGGAVPPIPIGNQAGGGGGYRGGGAGFVFSGDVAFIGEGGGGGGSGLLPPGTDGIVGGGSGPNTDGFVIIRPRNIALFKEPGVFQFQIPINAIDMTIKVSGANGGIGGTGPLPGASGGTGGFTSCNAILGGTSLLQPGALLEVHVGGIGGVGPDATDAPGSQAFGGFNGGGDGPLKVGAPSARGVSGGGGGASDIRLFPSGQKIVVAGGGGGGGGGGMAGDKITPGDGGGVNGGDALGQVASGGTQFIGGASGGMLGLGGDATGDEIESGGGGGGGYYGGGAGTILLGVFGSYGGGGGSGFAISDGETLDQGTIVQTAGGSESITGNGCVVITWTVLNPAQLPMGHYIEVPCRNECDPCGGDFNSIEVIEEQSNGVFMSAENTGFPISTPTCIFLTDGVYGDEDVPKLQDVVVNALPFQTPAPIFSLTKFETDVVVTPTDIESAGGFPLGGNNVDEVLTADVRYPGLNGLGWILATECLKNPIVDIQRDSNGTFSPVKPDLSVGDQIWIDSMHPTGPPLTGPHFVSYIDQGNAMPEFFELSDVVLLNIDGPIEDGNIWCFRVPTAANAACLPINEIVEDSCPTRIRVTSHGFPIGGTVSLYVQDAMTDPSINSTEGNVLVRDIINDVTVIDSDTLELPMTDSAGNTLCNIDVLNDTFTLTQPRGRFSKELLSTNCGTSTLMADPMNNVTLVTTPSRPNVEQFKAFPIISSTPHPNGSSTVLADSGGQLGSLWPAGTLVVISGHILGNPHLSGQYKIFNVNPDSFDILSGSNFASTGGTGGFVTGPAPSTVPGHGLQTGDRVKFSKTSLLNPAPCPGAPRPPPPLEGDIFAVTVIDAETFSIDYLINQPEATGCWCSDMVTATIPDHGLVDGDTFFLYSAMCVGGLLEVDLNTIHGDKRHNIPTRIELATQKTVRVLDSNNIQFQTNNDAFPTTRALGAGYEICISARNHTVAEVAAGLKNYGFSDTQTNLNCVGNRVQNFLNFSNDSYILLTSERLSTDDINPVLNTGPVSDVFTKVQLSDEPGDVVYNSFVGGERIFYEPINRLDRIDFQWRRADGKLFDFRGREHSFTLEIEEYQDRLRTTNKSSRRGINDPGAIGSIGLLESVISRENPVQNLAGALQPSQFITAETAKILKLT